MAKKKQAAPPSIVNRIVAYGTKPADQFQANPMNWRTHPEAQRTALAGVLESVGWAAPVIENVRTGHLIDGHERVWQALQAGVEVPYVQVDVSENEERTLLTTLDPIGALADTDREKLSELIAEVRSDDARVQELIAGIAELEALDLAGGTGGGSFGVGGEQEARATLADRFIVPPFSVLDARQGYWQERNLAWLELVIQSGMGRLVKSAGSLSGNDPAYYKTKRAVEQRLGRKLSNKEFEAEHYTPFANSRLCAGQNGNMQSVFDPVLCELAYRWFCPPGGAILDPFAGGSVRGIVAAVLCYVYTGIELRPEQIAANEEQAARICPGVNARWIEGDSRNLPAITTGPFDFVFSCPPYFDLELYSEDERDLSNAGEYTTFLEAYRAIIKNAVGMLRENRFACFVVGDVRDKKGFYRNFPADTTAAFHDAGAMLYNDAVLITAVGSLPIRAGKQFGGYRKLGKTHQNVLVFYKGNPKAIKAEFPEIVVPEEVMAAA